MIETINPYTAKIIITAKDNDSIRSISKKINLSYAWTYHWIQKLVDLEIIKRKGQTLQANTEGNHRRCPQQRVPQQQDAKPKLHVDMNR